MTKPGSFYLAVNLESRILGSKILPRLWTDSVIPDQPLPLSVLKCPHLQNRQHRQTVFKGWKLQMQSKVHYPGVDYPDYRFSVGCFAFHLWTVPFLRSTFPT